MNKLNKYLLHIQEGCGGACGGGTGNCGFPPIGRGGTGVCTDYQDFPNVQDTNNYQTQFHSDLLTDKIRECEGEENPLDIADPENSIETPISTTELPESGGEAGEKKKIIEDYIKTLNEQDEEIDQVKEVTKKEVKVPEEEPPVETPKEPTRVPEGGEAAGDMAATPGMEMPSEEEEEEVPQDPEYIGRVYELKKIYSRLISIESFLDDASDSRLLKLRNYISASIELFQTLINNVEAYKDKIDELIVLFYKFLLVVYTLLSKYYKQENKEDKQELIGSK